MRIGTVVEYQNYWVGYRLPIVAIKPNERGFSPSLNDAYDHYFVLEGLPDSKFWPHELKEVQQS